MTAFTKFCRATPAVALLLLAPLGLPGVWSSPALADMAHEPVVLVTAAGERPIDAEVASTPDDMARGLMFRAKLADDQGMLFPSPAPHEVNMWMKNTFIPLDMVFINADGTVRRIEAMTEPLSERVIASDGPVLAVLELAGGAAQRIGLKPGDKVRHRLFEAAR